MSCIFFLFLKKIVPKAFFLKFLDKALDFMGFFLGLPNQKNDINYIKYQFSHRFGKVCK